MNLIELAILYGVVGIGCAAAGYRRTSIESNYGVNGGHRVVDAAILVAFWPLYGPFLLFSMHTQNRKRDDGEAPFLIALRQARKTALGDILPDETTATALANRLRTASDKTKEIDELLQRSEFSEQSTRLRIDALQQRGASQYAIKTATIRLQNIRRLRAIRDRFARELEEVQELLSQLTTQVEVVRLAKTSDESMGDLVRELVFRVEGLDEMIDDDPHMANMRRDLSPQIEAKR